VWFVGSLLHSVGFNWQANGVPLLFSFFLLLFFSLRQNSRLAPFFPQTSLAIQLTLFSRQTAIWKSEQSVVRFGLIAPLFSFSPVAEEEMVAVFFAFLWWPMIREFGW